MNGQGKTTGPTTAVRSAAVTGASGCIGRALLAELDRAGVAEVKALHRAPRAAGPDRDRVTKVYGDLDDARALDELVWGVDVVYHCAATMEKSDPGLSHRVNVLGTRNVAEAALAAGVRRLVYVSSISVYAATRRTDPTITEDVEPENEARLNPYSRTKLQGERLLPAFAARGLECTIVRPTNVYGPWSRPWFTQWAALLRRTPWLVGGIPIDLVHVGDVAQALVQAAQSPMARDDVFHVGHETVLLSEFLRRVGRLVARPARPLPRSLDRYLRYAIETGYRLVTGRVMSLSLTRPVSYPHTRATRAFGYAPRISLDEGFDLLADWYATLNR